MLTHPLLKQRQELKLTGLFHAPYEQLQMTDLDHLTVEERFGLRVDREVTERANRRLPYRLQKAKLRPSACHEAIGSRHPRDLDKTRMPHWLSSRWLDEPLNGLITGPTGVGKTGLACALAHQSCRQGYTARYLRLSRLLQDLALARADGRYPR